MSATTPPAVMAARHPDWIPELPTQAGPEGIRFDFLEGCRVAVPSGQWRLRLRDLDTNTVLFDQKLTGGIVKSHKKYFIRFGITVWKDDREVFNHDYAAAGKPVLIRMELGGLGDQLSWIGHVAAFAEKHACDVTCVMTAAAISVLQAANPRIRMITVDAMDPTGMYALYKVLIFFNDYHNLYQPCDYRVIGLCLVAAYILGVTPIERRPALVIEPGGRPIAEPYVCIATKATTQSKYWNNPHGWSAVIAFLKQNGYRVICIDQKREHGEGIVNNVMPYGAEDETGNRPLSERARWLRHADFFIGLSSGLSWLAWSAQTEVVLISGFTHPINEFHTPYRVINWHVCNSCANDIRVELSQTDFFFCPRHKATDRMFECTKQIDPAQVITAIRSIPGFGQHRK